MNTETKYWTNTKCKESRPDSKSYQEWYKQTGVKQSSTYLDKYIIIMLISRPALLRTKIHFVSFFPFTVCSLLSVPCESLKRVSDSLNTPRLCLGLAGQPRQGKRCTSFVSKLHHKLDFDRQRTKIFQQDLWQIFGCFLLTIVLVSSKLKDDFIKHYWHRLIIIPIFISLK